MKYRVYYCIADFDEVLTKLVETEDIEEWCECFVGNSDEDIFLDYWEVATDESENQD